MVSQDYSSISYTELKDRLNGIADPFDRACLKTIYAGCARVGEVVRPRYKTVTPTQGKDVETTPGFLILHIRTEKTGRHRKVPIPRIDDPNQNYLKVGEAWLTEDLLEFYKGKEGPLFDKSTRWAEYKFNKYFPEFNNHIHFLRHWRATHLLSGQATGGVQVPYNVVAKIGGWIKIDTLHSFYDHTIIEDFVKL